MGTSRSPAELAGKFGRLANEYHDLPLSLVKESSLITKTTIKGIAPARLRGAGKRGAKLDVGYTVIGAGTSAQSLVYARGPWQLIERDTAAHRIPREKTGRGRRRYAVIPGVGVRAWAQHPGTKGQHPWRKGVVAARPVVGGLFKARGNLALRRIF